MHNFWPSKQQLLLLKACSANDANRVDYFNNWVDTLDIDYQKSDKQMLAQVYDQLDQGSQRQLPLLHHSITSEECEHVVLRSIKGYSRYIWSKNQIIFYEVQKVVQLFEQNGIDHFFSKGVPMSKFYYKHDSVRVMSDLDIVVKENDLDKSVDLLLANGWKDPFIKGKVKYKNLMGFSRAFVNGKDRELDLHWRLLKDSVEESSEAYIWENLIPFRIGAVVSKSLGPTDMLIHTILHGMQWNELPAFRWITDAMHIIVNFEIDWDRVAKIAVNKKASLRLRNAFTYLVEEFNAPIPKQLLEDLNNTSVSELEIKFFNLLMKEQRSGDLINIVRWYYQYKLYAKNTGLFATIHRLFLHYQVSWQIANPLMVPVLFLARVLRLKKSPYAK